MFILTVVRTTHLTVFGWSVGWVVGWLVGKCEID
jgi:hypothetical protein